MKRKNWIVTLVVLAVLLASSHAQAQRRGGMRALMGQGTQLASSLLAMEEVQDELNFTDEQKEAIGDKAEEINNELRSEIREIMQGGGDMAEVEEVMKELQEEEQELIAQLNDEQKSRLKQLRYQRMGMAIYQNEEAQKELKLSDDQISELKDAFEQFQQELQAAMEEARESRDFAAIRDTMQELQKELTETVDGILTDDQKQLVKELKGEEFEFPQRRRGRRGRSDF